MTIIIVLVAVGCAATAALFFMIGRAFPYTWRLDREYAAGRQDEYDRITQGFSEEEVPEPVEMAEALTAKLRSPVPPPAPAPAPVHTQEQEPYTDDDEIIEATTWFESLSEDEDEPITPPPPPSNAVQAVLVPRYSDDPRNDCPACTNSEGKCTCSEDCGALMCCGWAERDMMPLPRYTPIEQPDIVTSSEDYTYLNDNGGGGGNLTDILSWSARLQTEIDGWKYEEWATDVPAISPPARSLQPQLH